MDRQTFRTLAELRLREARCLLASSEWAGSYYLAGYSVECALKACISKNTRRFSFPDLRLAKAAYTHNLDKLVAAAGLTSTRDTAFQSDPDLETNWAIAKDWNPETRYSLPSQAEATDIVAAVGDAHHGVLAWLKQHW